MNNKLISKKVTALFIAGLTSAIALHPWLNVNAQTDSSPATTPKFTRLQDAKNFRLKGNGKAFQPNNLQQSTQPDQPDDKQFRRRGIIGWDDRIPLLSRKYPWSAISRVR
ncbi:hypothetical protein [Scytonema sp. UIC 10036]|uniref:hypothetical protein n=1 Tax=Scytonema sp. UIC 10036 TaxID=2304196 RepID=UPI001A9C0663|nr:hypothetical protein [Scytonema sp. UIC 10036]